MEKLALFFGPKVRTHSYPIHDSMINEEEEKQVLEVLRSKHLSGFSARVGERFLGGPKVKQFEAEIKSHFGVDHAVTFNSATTALQSAISALAIGPGDEVIVPPTTMSATATCIVSQMAVPRFADIENRWFGLDPMSVEKNINSRTKAILTVNLFGHPSLLHELKCLAKEKGLYLIEDNSQAPDAYCQNELCGTIGDIGIQSFNYHKGCQTGEGGAALTNSDQFALHMQLIRNHGEVVVDYLKNKDEISLVNMIGSNFRLTEIQAAIGIPQLKKLKQLNQVRANLAQALIQKLRKYEFLILPNTRQNCTHAWYLFPMRYQRSILGLKRETFVHAMNAEGISLSQGYMRPIYLEPMYQKKIAFGRHGLPFSLPEYHGHLDYSKGICPIAEKMWAEEFLITDICKFPNTEKEVEEFALAVEKIVDHREELKKWEKEKF